VLDVFRDPADPARRIGAAMLSQSVRSARAAGLSDLSLAVTHANAAARRLYERFGFADLGESWTLAMPV
jgi:ribosomal protein S18 acetylase RimI-like enzyme